MERMGSELETEVGGRTDRIKLKRLKIEGFKSLREVEVGIGDVTVLLGANGAGKSNLVSFFRMLAFLSTSALQEFVGRAGRSDSLLFGGRRVTPQIRAAAEFAGLDRVTGHRTTTTYRVRLGDAAPDTLIFLSERALCHRATNAAPREVVLGAGHRESRLPEVAREGGSTCRVLLGLLSGCRTYQFHDTSPPANIRKSRDIEDASHLRDDAGNLAPYLYALREARPDCYRRIVDTVRLVFPTFEDFSLAPGTADSREIILNWRERGRGDHLLGPHQLSDGSLRFMALATLLLQPSDILPNVIILDEPELGLHPYAISVLAAMVRAAASKAQVVLATQSPRLVDEFEPGDIVVLESGGGEGTKCHRPDRGELAEWLEEYSLGELWEKNHFGGRP